MCEQQKIVLIISNMKNMINNEITIFIKIFAKQSHNLVIEKIEFFFKIFYWKIENDFEIDEKISIVDYVKKNINIK